MPFFDYSNSPSTLLTEPNFWIYWAITIPLTVSVLIVYLSYVVWIERKNRSEDKDARRRALASGAPVWPDAPEAKSDRIFPWQRLASYHSSIANRFSWAAGDEHDMPAIRLAETTAMPHLNSWTDVATQSHAATPGGSRHSNESGSVQPTTYISDHILEEFHRRTQVNLEHSNYIGREQSSR